MFYYSILIATTFIISICSIDKHINNKIYILYFSLLAIIILSIFGGTRLIGLDYDVYEIHFNIIPTITKYKWTDPSIEIGYEQFFSFISNLFYSINYYAYVLVVL